jgi:hypothetical protein
MMRLILSVLLSLILLLSVSLGHPQPVGAIISQQEEAPGQMLFKSRHTLRDNWGESWQVILFKRVKDNRVQQVDLRLVGFPETAIFIHPQSLTLTTTQGKTFQASDRFAQKTPAPNVGEYDLQGILAQLSNSQGIQLSLPLESEGPTDLTIPLPVVLEWQELANF